MSVLGSEKGGVLLAESLPRSAALSTHDRSGLGRDGEVEIPPCADQVIARISFSSLGQAWAGRSLEHWSERDHIPVTVVHTCHPCYTKSFGRGSTELPFH